MTSPRVTTEDFEAYSYRVSRGWLRLHKHGSAEHGFYWMGEFIHPRGVVEVYRQDGPTRLDLLVDGRMCSRTWRCYWGNKTISRLSREFVEHMLGAVV